ncbi:uncharacterized protein LOC122139363 [Cyprinus carpio]|uniref:Uncharacterized protein LOC122139363 n=1 Tax=Cyprinus carpio TaxID=7962 RepID=A0A9Q9WYU1_CYPCA|nr:uncharacterized protein LOC122139363 [Cyprinus carpio]
MFLLWEGRTLRRQMPAKSQGPSVARGILVGTSPLNFPHSSRTLLPVSVQFEGSSHSCTALVDSGAGGSFLDTGLAKQWGIPAIPLATPISVRSLDDSPITTITHLTPPVDEADLSGVPEEYRDLRLVFSKSRAVSLPPHRPYDCAINLLPGTSPPRGRLYSLSGPEREAMDKYIRESLDAGLIRPSSSPAGAGFFFVKKKDGSLHPCIDYRGTHSTRAPGATTAAGEPAIC